MLLFSECDRERIRPQKPPECRESRRSRVLSRDPANSPDLKRHDDCSRGSAGPRDSLSVSSGNGMLGVQDRTVKDQTSKKPRFQKSLVRGVGFQPAIVRRYRTRPETPAFGGPSSYFSTLHTFRVTCARRVPGRPRLSPCSPGDRGGGEPGVQCLAPDPITFRPFFLKSAEILIVSRTSHAPSRPGPAR